MKTRLFLTLCFTILLISEKSLAQNAENLNPYAIFGANPYVAGADKEQQSGNKVFVIENKEADSPIGRMEHDTRTGIVKLFDKNGVFIEQKVLKPNEKAWPTVDPKAEKYYSINPYAFCAGNPIRFVDPNGEDIYRFDFKSGDFIMMMQTNDDFDQVGKFKYNRKTGEYTLKTNRRGEARTYIDDIDKDLLFDGINFRTDNNFFEIGGNSKLTLGGFESFIGQLADLVNLEIAGYYFSPIAGGNINYVQSSMYINNTSTNSSASYGLNSLRPDLVGKVNIEANFHTHPSYHPNNMKPSKEDIDFKLGQQKNGIKSFLILTNRTKFYY